MSLLTIVQEFCRRTNTDVPTVVISSTQELIRQIYALLQEECDDLVTRGDWQQLTREAVHTTIASGTQGAITTIAPGFDRFKPNTFWDRTQRLQLNILDGTDWQRIKATSASNVRYEVRIRGDSLINNPTATAGNIWAFEYISKNWVLAADGVTYKSAFTLDSDNPLFPEHVMKLGLRWRWKKEKGFEYAEDFRSYEAALMQSLAGNGLKSNLNMGTSGRIVGMSIPDGNWLL